MMPSQARAIIEEIARVRGIDSRLILSACRKRPVFRARIEVAQRLSARGYSSPQIGRVLNKDHCTVLYYLGTLGSRKPAPPKWRAPKIRHLRWLAPPEKRAAIPVRGRRYLIPYVGADSSYVWKERPARPDAMVPA